MKRVSSLPSMWLAFSPCRTIMPSEARLMATRFSSRSSLTYCSDRPFLILNNGRLRDVDVSALDQIRHVAEEESEQQRADVRSVDISVGHQDDLAVAYLRGVEVVLADAAAECRDHGADFLVPQHLVVAGLLHVQDLALQGKNRLEAAIASLLGGSACALTLDEIEFAAIGIAFGAVRELAGQATAIQCTLAPREVACLAGRLARSRRFNRLVDDLAGDWRILLEEHAQALVDECLHGSSDIRVELALGLPFKLRLRQFHAHDRYETFANVVAAQVFLHVLEQSELLPDRVDGPRQAPYGIRRDACRRPPC